MKRDNIPMVNCQGCSKSLLTKSEIGWSGLVWILGWTAGIVYFILDETEFDLDFATVWAILFTYALIYTSIAEFILTKLRKSFYKEKAKCKKCRNKAECERCGITISQFDAFGLLFHVTFLVVFISLVWGVESFLKDIERLSRFLGGSLNHGFWILTTFWLFLLAKCVYPRRRCNLCGASCKRCNQEVDQEDRISTIMGAATVVGILTYSLDPWYGCLAIFFGVVFVPYYLLGINKICDDCISEMLEPLAEWLDSESDSGEE